MMRKNKNRNLVTSAPAGQVYSVTTTVDSGPGSISDAINAINAAQASIATIIFNIPNSFATVISGVNYYIIQPGSSTSGLPLPTLSYPGKIKG